MFSPHNYNNILYTDSYNFLPNDHSPLLLYNDVIILLHAGTMSDVIVACFRTPPMLTSPTSGLEVVSFPQPMTSPSLAMPSLSATNSRCPGQPVNNITMF